MAKTPLFYRRIRHRVRRYLRNHDLKQEARLIIPRLIEKVTGRPRYLPDNLDWDSPLFTSYLFRAWQWLTFIPYGANGVGDTIRKESAVKVWHDEDGNVHVERSFYTLEALVTHIEGTARLAVKNVVNGVIEGIKEAFEPQPQFGYIPQPVFLTLMFLGLKLNLHGDLNGWLAPFVGMAIARDSSNKSVAVSTALSVSLTTSGTNRLLITGGVLQDGTRSWSSVTYAGNATTQINTNFIYSANSAPGQMRYQIAPTTGTNNAVFTPSGSINVGGYVVSYTGCHQTTPIDGNTKTSGGSSFNVSVTASNCWIVGFAIFFNNQNTNSGGGGYVTLAGAFVSSLQSQDDNGWLVDSNGTVATGNVAVQWSGLNSNNGCIAASIAPVSSVDVTVSATVVTATFSTPAPSVSGAANVAPNAVTATFSTPAPAISGGATVSVNPVTATFSLPAPNIITPDALVNVNAVTATFSLPSATVSGGANAQAGVVTATFSVPASSVQIDFTHNANAQTATFSTPAPTISAIGNVSVSAGVVTATFSLPSPTVSGEQNAIATVGVVTATFTVPAYTVTAQRNVTVDVDVVTATFSTNAPIKVGGLWTAQPRTLGDWTPQARVI